jgi:hypothetical protein
VATGQNHVGSRDNGVRFSVSIPLTVQNLPMPRSITTVLVIPVIKKALLKKHKLAFGLRTSLRLVH